IAILGGLGAALCFGASTLCSSRSSRLIGAGSVVAWVMLVGLVLTLPAVALTSTPDQLDAGSVTWLTVAGVGNVTGPAIVRPGAGGWCGRGPSPPRPHLPPPPDTARAAARRRLGPR